MLETSKENMKNLKNNIWILIIMIISIIIFIPIMSYASPIGDELIIEDSDEITSENSGVTQSDEIEEIKKDLYVFENSDYEMDKLVDGNAFIFASGNVKISGEVNGSVYVFSMGNVEVAEDAYIADALYSFAQDTTTISGIIYDLYTYSTNFDLTTNGGIARDAYIFANKATLLGQIYRNVNISSDEISLIDEEGNEFSPISGDFNYISKSQIDEIEEYVIQGAVNYKEKNNTEEKLSNYDNVKNIFISVLASAVYVLVIFGVMKIIAPQFKNNIGKIIRNNWAISLLVGLITMLIEIVAVVVSIILLFTRIFTPIALIALALMVIIIYISNAIFSISIYEMLKEKNEKLQEGSFINILVLAGISIAVNIIKRIPIIGGIAGLLIYLTGQGIIIKNYLPKNDKE